MSFTSYSLRSANEVWGKVIFSEVPLILFGGGWGANYKAVADPGFSPGGAPTPKIAIIFQIFAENCTKMKEFGPGGAHPCPPLDLPMHGVCLWGFSSRGVCLWRVGLHPGGPAYRGVCFHGGWTEPMDSEKLVVCILLEYFLLPPTNEVWGKVMFLHLSVSHFVQGVYTPQADTLTQIPPPQADTP